MCHNSCDGFLFMACVLPVAVRQSSHEILVLSDQAQVWCSICRSVLGLVVQLGVFFSLMNVGHLLLKGMQNSSVDIFMCLN